MATCTHCGATYLSEHGHACDSFGATPPAAAVPPDTFIGGPRMDPPPPADRPVAGWRTMTDEEFERIAEAMSGRTMYPGREPLRDERLLREAKAQRAEVARLTEERDSYRRGWNRAEDCQTRLRSQRDEAVRTATSALALAREAVEGWNSLDAHVASVAPRSKRDDFEAITALRAKLDAIATGGGD